MSRLSRQQRVNLFCSLFRAREDVFARRWENDETGGAGYAPVFTDWQKKSYKPLSQSDFENHLIGNTVLGVYPLLKDHKSHFIAADFDKKQWQEDVKSFVVICGKYQLPISIEISRSGNGAHAWSFFENSFPASKSRKIFLALLREAGCIDDYSHDESFDRLFPNQDLHSGKGLGNLIALPLQGLSRKEGKTVFVNPVTLNPYSDQWSYLTSVEQVSSKTFDNLYLQFTEDSGVLQNNSSSLEHEASKKLQIEVSNMLKLPKHQVSPILVSHLRDSLNFFNSEYFAKSKIGFSTHTIEKFFKSVYADDYFVYVPRGHINTLINFLIEHDIAFGISDKTITHEEIGLNQDISLYPFQEKAVRAFNNHNQGILVAPPGAGKTVMGLMIALSKKQPALIITHRQNIFDQWVESIENFFAIPKNNIGRYGSSTKKVRTPFTVAMIQTLARSDDLTKILDQFGCVLIDECHHVPAKTYRSVVSQISSKYLYGLTATPKRKYNDEKLIHAYLGETVHTFSSDYKETNVSDMQEPAQTTITILRSFFSVPYDVKVSDFTHIQKLLSLDVQRNYLIAKTIQSEVAKKRQILVLCQCKEHVKALWHFLKGSVEVFAMTGSLSAKQKKYRTTRIKNGTFQVVLATAQLFGEGVDIAHFHSLFLVSPHSFESKIIQYIGRLRGNGNDKRVFDVRDPQITLLEKSFKKRMTLYNKLLKSCDVISVSENDLLL